MFWYYYRPPPFRVKKKQKKKTGSATVYTQYIQQKLVTCTCTRHIFTWMNKHALSKVRKLQVNIVQISLSIGESYSQHLHVKYT